MLEFILQSGLVPKSVFDSKKWFKDRANFAPFVAGHFGVSGEQRVIVCNAASRRAPGDNKQQQIRAVLKRAEVRRVAEIGVSKQRQGGELGH
jgi:hypothetical protein